MATEMKTVLQSLNLENLIPNVLAEKISPCIVCKLSLHEFHALGVLSSTDIMRLRTKCISYGSKIHGRDGEKPRFDISQQMLESLLEYGFTISELSKLLSVCESTIFLRMKKYNLSVRDFTDIEDETLLRILKDITCEFPRCGESMLKSILYDRGL